MVLDEPPEPFGLEPYGDVADPGAAPRSTSRSTPGGAGGGPLPAGWRQDLHQGIDRLASVARRGRASLEADGAAATLSKAVDKTVAKVRARLDR